MSPKSQERLVRELTIIVADDRRAYPILTAARNLEYDDRFTPHATPKIMLIADLRAIGRHELAQRVIDGEFDTTSEEWKQRYDSPMPPERPLELRASGGRRRSRQPARVSGPPAA